MEKLGIFLELKCFGKEVIKKLMKGLQKIYHDFSSMEGIFHRPAFLNQFAQKRMQQVRDLLQNKEVYNCAPECNNCCYGSILMSYTEFNYIMLYLQSNWSGEKIKYLLEEKVGILQDRSTLLCPFLQENAKQEHCSIYPARPLICRIFGTTASPCREGIKPSMLSEELFFHAYQLLYYDSNIFIALHLDTEWALFEAPFALWCLADNSKESRFFLRDIISGGKDSFHAVLFDLQKNHFFVLKRGEKVMLNK